MARFFGEGDLHEIIFMRSVGDIPISFVILREIRPIIRLAGSDGFFFRLSFILISPRGDSIVPTIDQNFPGDFGGVLLEPSAAVGGDLEATNLCYSTITCKVLLNQPQRY